MTTGPELSGTTAVGLVIAAFDFPLVIEFAAPLAVPSAG